MDIAFIIWSIGGCVFIGMGIYAIFSKKPMGFWANAEMFELIDMKQYNYAMAKLFCVYGVVFILLGLPMLSEQNSPWILLSVIGLMVESIIAMVVYSLVIEKKYKRKDK